jgi:hypothetical protein
MKMIVDEAQILKALDVVFKPYFEDDINPVTGKLALRIPGPEPAPNGDFIVVELADEDPEGFRIGGYEPPGPDEVDDERHLARIAELRAYVREVFHWAGIDMKAELAKAAAEQ